MSSKRSAPNPPPIGLDDGDDVAAAFFAELPAPADQEATEVDDLPPRRPFPPPRATGGERRTRLVRAVASVVALSGALCVAGAVRAVASRAESLPGRPAHPFQGSSHVLTQGVQALSSAPARAAPPPLAAPTDAGSTGPPEPGASSRRADTTAAARLAVPPHDFASAREAKQAAQQALERGDVPRSIRAGEQSVASDPTDAEAWLILGGAYAQRGAHAAAHRCFATCVQAATRGPRSECASLLR